MIASMQIILVLTNLDSLTSSVNALCFLKLYTHHMCKRK